MSSLLTRPVTPASPPAANGEPAPDAARPPDTTRQRDSQAVRLAAFAALALFATLHWTRLVVDPPQGRLLLIVALSVAGGAALPALRALTPPVLRFAVAAAVSLGLLLLCLVVAGLHVRFLAPGNWGELIDGLDRGLSGIQAVGWPYDGPDAWVRLTTLLGAPFLLALAAALAFWPARRGGAPLRAAGLVLLLLLYGIAVTEHDPGQPLLRGLLLLVLVAAWLWLPRLETREAALGAGAVLAMGILAMPLSARFDADRPWWDYRAWDWFGAGESVTFDWSHRYGPLDWPRDGTTLLNVRAERPHYWKAETLDDFDGFRWVRSGRNDSYRVRSELPPQGSGGRRWDYFEYNPRWERRIGFTVRSLTSSRVIGAGITFDVDGIDAVPTADGTTPVVNGVLEEGDSYSVRAYVPTPSPAQLAGAPSGYPYEMHQYTEVRLPTQLDRQAVEVPLRGDAAEIGSPDAHQRLLASPYGRVYRLARRLTDGAPNVYAAVRRVEQHLEDNYRYFERVPRYELPLDAFLFEDRVGYCQQFSGAMALMLRMAGIPARVAAGFTRGSFNRDSREWRVRDLDAHSWVEVNFPGVGWVDFDPTPAAAPAEGQTSGFGDAGPGGAPQIEQPGDAPASGSEQSDQANAGAADGGPRLWPAALLLALGALGAGVVLLFRASRARRSLAPDRIAELQVAELRQALTRLGWALPGGVTLLGLERRLRRAAGPASADYAARLRAHRYDAAPPRPPGLRARRALRRELGSGGLRQRLRAVLAIPPGGPRVRQRGF
jgi:transglutaminase-like putative cysteine protease